MIHPDSPAVEFVQVNYAVRSTPILKEITGSFPKGNITTLVGPSGAGKTTLLKMCNGLISPDTGDIYVLGKNIRDCEPAALRRTVGIALQNAPMVPGSVQENLALPLKLQGKPLPQALAAELMQVVGLKEDLLTRNVKDLSGGQRQKVSIARTLVNRPQVLLLDEITSSLDRASQQEIEELIMHINRQYGTTIIWITHNLDQALSVGAYTWVMMDGRIVETGESSLLLTPADERVRRFVKGAAT